MAVLTFDRAVEELHRAVELKGADHVAEECIISNEDTGQPVCLVGQVLYQLAPDLFVQEKPQGTTPVDKIGYEFDESDSIVVGEWGYEIPRAERLLLLAQDYQDGGRHVQGLKQPWGRAVEFAEKYVDQKDAPSFVYPDTLEPVPEDKWYDELIEDSAIIE